jgi:hypothetical protein
MRQTSVTDTDSADGKAVISIITSEKPDLLTKTFSTTDQGDLKKESGGQMCSGWVETKEIASLADLASVLESLKTNQALCFGIPAGDFRKKRRVVSEKMLPDYPDAIARTLDHFTWIGGGAGVMMLDYDPEAGAKPIEKEELVKKLRSAIPALKYSKMLWLPSSSSHIFDAKANKDLTGLRGQRVYVLVKDAADIERAGQAIHRRLWLKGFGRIEISAAGSLLERSLVDASVWQANRLDFAAGAHCAKGLEQRRGSAQEIPGNDEFLDTELIASLSAEEEKKYKSLVEAEKAKLKPAAAKVQGEHIEKRVQAHPGADKERLRAEYKKAYESGDLTGGFQIIVIEGGQEQAVTVDNVLQNPERFDGLKTLDPIEPEYNARHATGILYLTKGKPNLYSLAHGGRTFYLKPAVKEVENKSNRLIDSLITSKNMQEKFKASLNQPWRIDGVLPYGGLAVVFGAFKSFKSFIALDMALSIASGQDWHGREVKQAPVLYIAAEGQAGILKRVEGWKIARKQSAENFYLLPRAVILNDNQQRGELVDLMSALPSMPELVVVDTLNRCMNGDENSTSDMTSLVAACGEIYQATGATVMLVHHCGKDAARGSRGSTVLPGAAEIQFIVTRKGEEYLTTLKCDKLKDAEPFRDMFFDLVEVDTEAIDSKGSEVKTLVPSLNAAIKSAPEKRKLPGKRQLVLNALMGAIKECNATDVSYEQWRDVYYSVDTSESHRVTFYREYKQLIQDGLVLENCGRFSVSEIYV